MIIYLASTGNYSDYRIRGVFSTHEMAQQFLGDHEDANEVEPMELDKFSDQINAGMFPYDVEMYVDTGDTKRVARRMFTEDYMEDKQKPVIYDEHIWAGGKSINTGRKVYKITVIANSPEHAAKIVNEKRVQYIAASNKL
jgi:hypothetical protein